MTSGRLLAFFLLIATALRWFWGYGRPLSPEESYLALCGFIPSLAYFDGPGGTPLLVALGISTAGSGGFGATFFWPVFAALASIFAYLLVAALAGRREGLAVAILLNLLPVFNEEALSATCAIPLTATALGASLCAWHALEKNSAAWWTGAGLCAASGLLFTYTAWLVLPALALVLLTSHRWRRRLLGLGFWFGWIPPLGVYLLLLRWNQENGWIHFIDGTWRTARSLDFTGVPAAIFASVFALTPFAFFALLCGVFFAMSRFQVSPKIKFLALPAFVATLVAAYSALRGWPPQTPGLLAAALALPLIAWLPDRIVGAPTKTVLSVLFLGSATWTALTLPRPPSSSLVDTSAGQAVTRLRSEYSDSTAAPFLIAENAPLAAALALVLPGPTPAAPGHPPVYTTESPAARSQFDLWPRYDQFVEAAQTAPDGPDPFTEQQGANPFIGRNALYITTQQTDELPQAITAAFKTVQLLEEATTPAGPLLRVFLCSDYQTMPM